MRGMTRNAPFGLNRSMLINKWSLFIRVTLDASCIGSCRQSCLFEFKSAVRIVAVTALHCSFQHFVMERQIELVFCLAMTTETKLWFAIFE